MAAAGRIAQACGVGVGAALLGACGGEAPAAGPGPATVEVAMRDYAFDFRAFQRPGRAVFVVTNRGSVDHEMYLLPLPDDLPPIAEQLKGSDRRFLAPLARVRAQSPGQVGRVAVDLVAGRYAVACFMKDGDGTVHASRGMTSEFRVEDGDARASRATSTTPDTSTSG